MCAQDFKDCVRVIVPFWRYGVWMYVWRALLPLRTALPPEFQPRRSMRLSQVSIGSIVVIASGLLAL